MNVKDFGPAVGGVVVGVTLTAMVHVFTQAGDSANGGLITPITADGSLFTFIGHYLGYFFTHVPGLIMLIASAVFYLITTIVTQHTTGDESDGLAVLRGILIGIGASMNGVLAYNIYGPAFGSDTAGIIIAIVLFLLAAISSVGTISKSDVYQGIIGWICWFAPMSWVVLVLGFLALIVSVLIGLILGLPTPWEVTKVGGKTGSAVAGKIVQADWKTGTFFLVGGIIANLNHFKTAFNLGNLGFVHRDAQSDHLQHEAGHNLNLFVFGWIFHLIGALDENLPVIGNGGRAFSERLANSNDPGSGDQLMMWN
ncbi:MAG: hypothetical protein U0670_18530 [Anaerolineae bacterium]